MAQLVLLVVAAAWAAVLIPPMLRSRVENRPNSSVTDFRRQLNTLQSTSTPPRGSMRAFGRPLAQSPLQRPAAAGRPSQAHHRQASLHGGSTATRSRQATPRSAEARPTQTQYRTHGDPTGGVEVPHRQTHMDRPDRASSRRPARAVDPRSDVRRRRTNVLFLLLVTTACTLFLAATTSSTVLLYVFALSFLALCGYIYLLAQLRQRESVGYNDGWIENY
ncbi:MAG: hypothetical protein WBP59_12955 [Ilumatobacteraceae bacterium]